MENGKVYRAAMFIDATYEGDLMAKAGVSYTVGREANCQVQRDAQRHSGRDAQASVHRAGGSVSEARRSGAAACCRSSSPATAAQPGEGDRARAGLQFPAVLHAGSRQPAAAPPAGEV